MAVRVRQFGELFAEPTRNGLTRPKAKRGQGIKMVNMGELFAHPRIIDVNMERVPVSASEFDRFTLKEGDLLFARQSLVLEGAGKCSIFLSDDESVTFESHITRVRLNLHVACPSFYFYYLQSHEGKSTIRSIVEQGAGAAGIRGSDLASVDVRWCPVPEQRAIAHILGTLDDKIEVNRRMSATLEAMARALFKSWFVDFDPVRAKAEGCDPGLPPDLAALFPDRLVDTDDGEVPEGWRAWQLDELADHHRRTVTSADEPDRVFKHYSIPAYDAGREPALDLGRDIKSNKTVVPAGAVLLSKLNPEINRVWLPALHEGDLSVASTEFLCFTPRPPASRALLFSIFRSDRFRTEMEAMVTGTSKSHQRVNAGALMQTVSVIGSASAFAAFDARAWPLLERTLAARAEIRTLAALRDTLLPKLVSGELRVQDAETFLERVL